MSIPSSFVAEFLLKVKINLIIKLCKKKELNKDELKKLSLDYMTTIIDVARESILILNSDLLVIAANPTFYKTFQVLPKETEGNFIYDLGDGQWNIPALKDLLKKILPSKKTVKDYEVKHVFQKIGKKIILINAKQIDSVQLIVVAMEDITDKKTLEEKLAEYTKGLEVKINERTEDLSSKVKELESLNKTMIGRELKMIELKKEIENLKKQFKNGNGKNGSKKNGNGKNGNGKNGNGNNRNS